MPKITIDEIELDVEDGLNVIQAASRAGVEIPHFCYHPSLSVVAQCRQCLVEVEGVPKVLPACNTAARDGLVVRTGTEKALEARKAAVEFTLINHPLDCPICDKGGECPLQMTAFGHGPGYSRIGGPENKKVRRKRLFSDRIVYDPNRCIMCTRCVRFTDEVTKTGELGTTGRGFRKKISVFPGKTLDNELAGNVIDICPVGALLPRDTLHEERVWYMEFTDSVCSLCSSGCNVTVGADPRKGRISRVRPRANPQVNGHWICDRGRYGHGEIQESRRLRSPIARKGDGHETASWEEVLESLLSGLRETVSSGSSCAVIASATLTNEEMFLARKLSSSLGGALACAAGNPEGKEKRFGLVSDDPYPNSRGARSMGMPATDGLVDTITRLSPGGRGTGALIVVGEDLFGLVGDREKPALRSALGRTGLVAVVDYRLTETAGHADFILPAASPYEKDGTFTNDSGRVQKVSAALAPPGEARQGWEILLSIGSGIDGRLFDYGSPSEIMDEMSLEVPAYAGMSYDAIGPVGKVLEGAAR